MENSTATIDLAPAAIAIRPTSLRTITWPTNYNNKMSCSGFIHIDQAPFNKPIRSEVEQTIIEISTSDKSHPPIRTQLLDILFLKLKKIPECMTLASHGMEVLEFAVFIIDKYPGKVELDTELAVYYYKQVF